MRENYRVRRRGARWLKYDNRLVRKKKNEQRNIEQKIMLKKEIEGVGVIQ